MDKVSREIATDEITGWLDYKKVNGRKRESYAEQIDVLIDAVCDGSLEVQETHTLKHNLKFPFDNDTAVASLEYAPRLKMKSVYQSLQGVKSGDADGRVCAYVAALTSRPKELIKAMDTEDYSIAQSIAIFFL